MQDDDYVWLKGPSSLAEVVAIVDPNAPVPADGADWASVDITPDVFATVQYDAVDEDTWPYMIGVESRADGLSAAVRAASRRIIASAEAAGWQFRLTSDIDDAVVVESAPARAT